MVVSNSVVLYQDADTELSEIQQNIIDIHGIVSVYELPNEGLFVQFTDDVLSLCKMGRKEKVCVDFVSGQAKHRRFFGGGELIAKAVNARSNKTVWDFTAGLGRDAFVLASLGVDVTLFERHPIVAALLADGINRAGKHEETADIAKKMHLVFADVLNQNSVLPKEQPKVIYLDPMYPSTTKSAAVKKEMAFFHDLVGYHPDDQNLLSLAKAHAKQRVVVKRPRLGEYLGQVKPDYQYEGKSTRFDVYIPDYPEPNH